MRRKKYTAVASLLIIPLLLVGCDQNRDPRKLKFDPIKFDAPKTERTTLENGAIIHLLNDHELPLINMAVKIKGGSIYDPIGKEGLADLTTALIRSGGVKGMTAEEIDQELEFIGGAIEAKSEGGETNIVLSVLSKDIDKGLTLLSKIIKEPAFRGDKILLEKGKFVEAIRRENDNPEDVGVRELIKKIYSGGSSGRFPTVESVNRIGLADLRGFRENYFRSENMIIGISGDFDKKYILQRIGELFKEKEGGAIKFPDIKPPVPVKGIYLIERNIAQSVIRMGHLGLKKSSPDNHAVRVMNRILGEGGFNSRLMKEVRTARGLAYSVGSSFKMGHETEGLFMAGCDTKPESTVEALEVILKTMDDMRTTPVTDEELAIAKDSIINSFAFAFKGPDEVMLNRLNVEYYGLPEDYIETFREKIDAVTKEDVLRVAQKYLRPDEMAIVVVGKKDALNGNLPRFKSIHRE
ncbi:MAG: pitrilysin family protein [Nitrospinota bacterium]